jgi:hypothetical protein
MTVWLVGRQGGEYTPSRQDLGIMPSPTVVTDGFGGSRGRYWLEADGGPVPLPPPELLRDEPADSPAMRGSGPCRSKRIFSPASAGSSMTR